MSSPATAAKVCGKCVSCADPPGYSAGAPFAAIHVGAAAPSYPDALVEQLDKPGRLVVPVNNDHSGTQCVHCARAALTHQRHMAD